MSAPLKIVALSVGVIAVVIGGLLYRPYWSRQHPVWSVHKFSNGAVIRNALAPDTMPRAIIKIEGMPADSTYERIKGQYQSRSTYSAARFLPDSAWECYSVGYADSLRIGRCRKPQDSIVFLFMCYPGECEGLKSEVARAIVNVESGRSGNSVRHN